MKGIRDVLFEFYLDIKSYSNTLDGKEYEEARDRAYERAEQGISLILAQSAPTESENGDKA